MNEPLIYVCIAGNLAGFLFALIFIRTGHKMAALISKAILIISWMLITWIIIYAWIEYQRPPFKTLYESLLLFSWCIGIVSFFSFRTDRYPGLWMLSALSVTIVLIYSVYKADIEVTALPPALQSVWFVPHVVVYFIGYSALVIGTIGFLIGDLFYKLILRKEQYSSEPDMDLVTLSTIRTGYIFLTAGLIMGALWADESWGTYWGWDVKESWALVTFLIYGSYFHLLDQKKIAIIGKIVLIIGLFTIMFTYLGMHLLPTANQSLHVYQ